MTNEEKAKEIQRNDVCCVWDGGCPNVYHAAMEMAKWKEQQMIDKACEWLEEFTIDYVNDTRLGFGKEEFIKNFRKAMKGGGE